MKYVVIEVQGPSNTIHVPFVFPEICVHAEVAQYMVRMLEMQYNGPCRPVSAGFISSMSFELGQFCHGESESLKLKADPVRDTQLIRMLDYGSIHLYKD